MVDYTIGNSSKGCCEKGIPLRMAPYHMEELCPMLTSPMTEALGATKETWSRTGRRALKGCSV